MTFYSDVIIVGSGAAGVSAAWPLVQAGFTVTMLDQGRTGNDDPLPEGSYLNIRTGNPGQWKTFIGRDFWGLKGDGHETPKFKVPRFRHVLEGFEDAYNIHARGLTPTGSLARGGITKMWGAGVYAYDDTDLAGYPIEQSDLIASYKNVAARIGVSGVDDDDLGHCCGGNLPLQPPLPLHENARRLLARYSRRGGLAERFGISIGRARNAVLTEPLGERGACTLTNMCLWGCRNESIYSASHDVDALLCFEKFRYVDRSFVSAIEKSANGYRVRCRDIEERNPPHFLESHFVVLAAGTIATTRLTLSMLGLYGVELPLICHPTFAMAFVLPERIGAATSETGFALGQLCYKVNHGQDPMDYAFGVIFSAEGLMISDIARHIPLTRPSAFRLTRYLLPALLVANCYLSGDYTRASLRLDKDAGQETLSLSGDYSDSFLPTAKGIARRIARFLLRLGIVTLPTGIKIGHLGSDGHFAGTLPMRHQPDVLATTPECEVPRMPGVFVADGASLSRLPAKFPTFTIMANADRIGRLMAKRLRGGH